MDLFSRTKKTKKSKFSHKTETNKGVAILEKQAELTIVQHQINGN